MASSTARIGGGIGALIAGAALGFLLFRALVPGPERPVVPAPYRVLVETSPAGAALSLNGEPVGAAPLQLELAPRFAAEEFLLSASHPGHQTQAQPLTPANAGTLRLTLPPAAP